MKRTIILIPISMIMKKVEMIKIRIKKIIMRITIIKQNMYISVYLLWRQNSLNTKDQQKYMHR